MDPSAWQVSGSYFRYNGNRIFYKMEGTGVPLLLLHGFPTASWDWHLLWPALREQFQTIALDFVGFGFSDKPLPYPYSIFDQADLVEELLADLDIKTAHILAHDYGDTVAQELLFRHREGVLPFHVHSVCFLNGGLFPHVHRLRLIQKMLATPLGPLMAPFLGRKNLERSFHRIFGKETQPDAATIDAFWQLIEYNTGRRVIPHLISYMRQRKQHASRWIKALKKATIPLRLIDGGADPISGRPLAEHYRREVPQADVVILPSIGHYPQVEAPAQVLRHFLEFLEKVF